jgi:peroxiredoxin Q/BCP
LRDGIQESERRDAQVLVIAPDTLEHARTYFQRHDIPFPCLADPDRRVFRQYDVKSALVSLGQRPGLFIVDGEGMVRYAYLGRQQWEIPSVQETLRHLDALGLGSSPKAC